MKQLKYIFTTFAVALLATSCSQDELLDDGGTEEVPVTFTATVDYAIETQGDDAAGNMKQAATRATSTEDDAPNRFYAQAVSNGTLSDVVTGIKNDDGTYSFTLQVAKDTKSDYMFWADNAAPGDEPADLRSVPYTMGGIAFAAKAQGTPEAVNKDVKLQHVVAKVTLKTTTDVTSEYSKNISLTVSCASTYNVLTASASDFSDKNASKEMTDAGLPAKSEVLTTYIIPNPDDKTVTLGAHEMTQAISDVPLVANTNVTLQGDLSESSSKWGNPTDAYIEKKFRSYFFDENGLPKGYYDSSNYKFKNGNAESITTLFKEITRNDSFAIPSMGGYIDITNNLTLVNSARGDYVRIQYYNDTDFFIYYYGDENYNDFSTTIYPGANIN